MGRGRARCGRTVFGSPRATAWSTTITDPGDALGPQPEQREQQRDWERARKAIARDERRLGRDVEVELDVDLGIGF